MGKDAMITCHCFYREDGKCFLGLLGPMKVCQGYQAPAKVNPAPLDPEWARKWEGFNQK